MMLELTILMPCLNEARTVAACVDEAMGYLRASGVVGEVLVCDNGSTDGSDEIAAAHGARVVRCLEMGYGHALRFGMGQALGECIIMGDCDCSYDFSAIGEMHRLLKDGADMVIGNRFAEKPDPRAISLSHRIGVPFLSWAARLRFHSDVRDFHCGLRGVRRDVLDKMTFTCGGMEFATEMIAEAEKARLRIAQVPVVLRPDGRDGPPHLRTVRDGLRHLRYIARRR